MVSELKLFNEKVENKIKSKAKKSLELKLESL
jgi:hypothetical protein